MTTIRRIFAGLVNLWESEPVAITGIVTAILDVAVASGLPVTPEQKTAVIGLVTAIGIAIARKQVTPVTAPSLPSGTIVNDGAGVVVKV